MRANAKMGITLQESMQILDVREPISAAEVAKRYAHLFEANDKSKGGTLYLQSKVILAYSCSLLESVCNSSLFQVFRAKQRLDDELSRMARDAETQQAKQQQFEHESKGGGAG